MQNLNKSFDLQYIGQIIGGDFAKFCGLLRIYELYYLEDFVARIEVAGGMFYANLVTGILISKGNKMWWYHKCPFVLTGEE